MNNKSRIIIGVIIAVLFVIGIVALVQTQTDVTTSEPTKITNQNNTQIQNNSTDTIEMESLTIVKYALNTDKSSKVNTEPKSVITDKSSKVNTEPKSVITDKSSKVNNKPNDSAKNELKINKTTYFKNSVIKKSDGKVQGCCMTYVSP